MKTYHPIRTTLLLTLISLPGVLTLLPATAKLVESLPPGAPPLAVMLVLTVIQTMILTGVAALIGSYTSPKVGFKAIGASGRLAHSIRQNGAPALIIGLLIGATMVALDLFIFRSFIPETMYMLSSKPLPFDLVYSLLYGGVVEEVMIRWGVMGLLTWLLYRLFQGAKGEVRGAFVWIGILISALLFGLLHLPAVRAMVGEPTTAMLIRTLVQNGLPGLGLGYLFARRGLDSAIIGHMGLHIAMFLLRLLFA